MTTNPCHPKGAQSQRQRRHPLRPSDRRGAVPLPLPPHVGAKRLASGCHPGFSVWRFSCSEWSPRSCAATTPRPNGPCVPDPELTRPPWSSRRPCCTSSNTGPPTPSARLTFCATSCGGDHCARRPTWPRKTFVSGYRGLQSSRAGRFFHHLLLAIKQAHNHGSMPSARLAPGTVRTGPLAAL